MSTGANPVNPFWSRLVHELYPYVPGEQPRMSNLVKLNTNESPFGPSPRVLDAIRAEAGETLRLYPDPEAVALRRALASYHGVRPEQVFVGNGSDEVLAHAFVALLRQDAPLLFPDITYGFFPAWCRLFGISAETVPLDSALRIALRIMRARPEPSSSQTRTRPPASRSAGRRSRRCCGHIPNSRWW
jgi:histidinol-phosphate aminotransferase